MSEIKAVIFDVGGVLALGKYQLTRFRRRPLGKSFHEAAARELGVDMDSWFDAIGRVHDDANEGLISVGKALEKMARNLDFDPRIVARAFVSAYRKSFVFNHGLIREAFALKKKGYKIALLSDQWPISRDVLIPHLLRRHFDEVVISCEVKMRKPQPKIYRLILRRLGLKASECVFIDNRDWNLVPAKKMGMKTILFEGNRKCLKDLRKFGVEV
jgi:epoxide hydrolase-like predicted phosphatase